jgi:hypothetical protein
MGSVKTESHFEIIHRLENGKNIVAITPKTANRGYPPVEIELSKEQWDALQYSFAKLQRGSGDATISKLAYVF